MQAIPLLPFKLILVKIIELGNLKTQVFKKPGSVIKSTKMKRLFFIAASIILLFSGAEAESATIGESQHFYVQIQYDSSSREELTAVLISMSAKAYFYLDRDVWHSLSYQRQNEVKSVLENLGSEFDAKIHPILTSTYGSELKPGVDGDARIYVLFHPMKKEVGGYFNSGDEYLQIQVHNSNQKEMVYLNSQYIDDIRAKSFLANEFVHLLVFSQKEWEYNVSEEIWLNEARSEYASALLGYENTQEGNPFLDRMRAFSKYPTDSVLEWKNKEIDYAAINVFIHYLIDHYGMEILVDSLHSDKTGIESLNYALEKNGFSEDFSQIFTDWTVAVFANDCSLSEKYCYKSELLKDLHIAPSLNYLPVNGESSLVLTGSSKGWAGNWYTFVGGSGDLKLRFVGSPEYDYKIPYLTKDLAGKWVTGFLELDSTQKGEILIPSFGKDITSLTIIPSLQGSYADGISIPFLIEASTIKTISDYVSFEKPVEEMTEAEIVAKIGEIEIVMNRLMTRLDQLTHSQEGVISEFSSDLSYGLMNDPRVENLQRFLRDQEDDIYPEGFVTGNFLDMTKEAVIRFQEKYTQDILIPLGLEEGTGFVGPLTRAKINEILGY